MITVFSRREAAVTHSMEEQARIRDVLACNGIDYTLRVVNRTSPSVVGSARARTGTFGVNMDYAYEYTFYVHKKDLDAAKALIGSKASR